MVGSDKRLGLFVQVQFLQRQGAIEVDVIEVKQGEHSRVCPRAAEMMPDVCPLQMRAQGPGDCPTQPLIEISQNNPSTAQIGMIDDAFVQQAASLGSMFKEGSAEMDIKDMYSPRAG